MFCPEEVKNWRLRIGIRIDQPTGIAGGTSPENEKRKSLVRSGVADLRRCSAAVLHRVDGRRETFKPEGLSPTSGYLQIATRPVFLPKPSP